MRVLLDTCAFLWFLEGDPRMPRAVVCRLLEPTCEVFVSLVSFWEIQIKYSLGKLTLQQPPELLLPQAMTQNGFVLLPLDAQAIFQWGRLPWHHRDPFDRLLIAQANINGLEVITNDSVFQDYPVRVVWDQ